MNEYIDYAVSLAEKLLSIDSPTGNTSKVAEFVKTILDNMGIKAELTNKGGVLADLGGESDNDALLIQAHLDTIGCMVSEIKPNGRLKLTGLGGVAVPNIETENCRIITKFSGVYEGTVQLINPSIHVNGEYRDTKRDFDTVELVVDEDIASKQDAEKLGIRVGDFVCLEPNFRLTKSGYIKSRFLDDKLSSAVVLSLIRFITDNKSALKRQVYVHFTVYEEVGHGGSASIPEGVSEVLAVDMGCVGTGIGCTEKQVSICAKDAGGPYSYPMVKGLIEAAEKAHADYAVDVYPHYGSDAEAALRSGADVRHGLIGPGVYASHGYERSHREGVKNTLLVLLKYLGL